MASPERAANFPVVASIGRDRRGPGAIRPGVKRLLILKLDHIGDVLIAAPALMLLRRSFADAHVTLVCGPWNVGLVRRLGVADEIVAASIFSQVSLADLDPDVRAERQRAAVEELRAKGLGPFDLAIDLRRDDDTRDILKLFEAKAYAGFGDLTTFSYLDVALPFQRYDVHQGAAHVRLTGADLDGGRGHRLDADGLHLTARHGTVDLTISTDTVWAPTEEGVPDTRLLATALSGVSVRRRTAEGALSAPIDFAREEMAFGPGWLGWEPWGRWSSLADASVRLQFPTSAAEVELIVRVQGHVAPVRPKATVRLSAPGGEVAHTFASGDEPVVLALPCRAALSPPTASSEPILMRPGRYRGLLELSLADPADWAPLALTVRSGRDGLAIGELVAPETVEAAGVVRLPFDFDHKDAAQPVVIEIRPRGEADASRMSLVAVELDCLQARAPVLPVGHMEGQLLDLAAMTALRFAPTLVPPGEEVEQRLCAPAPGSSAAEAVVRLRARRGGKRLFGLLPDARMIIGVGLGANKETKRWPEAYFLELCRKLLARRNVDLAFFGGPKEAEEVAAVVAALDGGERVLNLCSACRIEDLGEALAELDGFIGLDTGTTHFAGRVGVKTLSLFGASHDPAEWGPVGPRTAWAAVDVPCSSCFKAEAEECPFALRCMTELKPKDVWPLVERHILQA